MVRLGKKEKMIHGSTDKRVDQVESFDGNAVKITTGRMIMMRARLGDGSS